MIPRIKNIIFLLICLSIVSCRSELNFMTSDNLAWNTNTNHISRYEVSVSDWITYMVATTFRDHNRTIRDDNYEPFNLGDSIEKIKLKLPELEISCWSNYVIKAFLRKDHDMIVQQVYNHCENSYIELYVSKVAWDSIKKYKLLDLPIVGITYDQALEYVEYKQTISNACNLYIKESKNKYRYECFLPTPTQFDSFQTLSDSFYSCPRFNFKNSLCLDCPSSKSWKNHPIGQKVGVEPIYINQYFPNYYGIYNFKGNVAEMTSVKGIAKGGSCQHYASEAYPGRSQEYIKPEVWLGFRVWYKVYNRE